MRTRLQKGHMAAWAMLAILAMPGALVSPAQAQPLNHERAEPEEALAFVSKIKASAQDILADPALAEAERTDALRALFSRSFNTRYIALFALGPYRREMPETARRDYETLFGNFLFAKYIGLVVAQKNSRAKAVYAANSGRRDAIVYMMVEQPDGTEIDTEWRVRTFDGEMRVIDVAVAGASLTQNQRREFGKLIKEDGFAGLFAVLGKGEEQT